jgi:MFS family permease
VSIRLLFTLAVLAHLSFGGCRVILALTAIHHQASPFTVGILMSLLTVIPMFFALRWGRWVDRVGVRVPMLWGVVAIFLAMVLGWALPALGTLFIVSMAVGTGFFLFHIAAGQAAALIGKPEDRVRNFSLLTLAFSIAGLLGPTIAGLAIDSIGHYGAMLLLSAGALAGIVVLASLKNTDAVQQQRPAHAQQEKRRVTDLFRVPALRLVFVVGGIVSVTWDLFMFVMPIHGSQIGLSATTIGIILSAFGAAALVVRFMLPAAEKRLGKWRILMGGMLISGAALLAFPLIQGVPLLMALSFVLGVGMGGTQPLVMSLLYEKAPTGRGAEVLSVRTLLINFSHTGVPLTFGALGAALGMLPIFWAMGAGLLATSFAAARRR